MSLTAYCFSLLEKDLEQLKRVQAVGSLLPMASPCSPSTCLHAAQYHFYLHCFDIRRVLAHRVSVYAPESLDSV